MTPEQDALKRVVGFLIDPDPEAVAKLANSLSSAGFYVDAAHAQDALRRRRQFNAIEMQSGFKIDFIIRKERPFSHEELRRREPAELAGGIRVALATAEDTILSFSPPSLLP